MQKTLPFRFILFALLISISCWSQNQSDGIFLSFDNINACQIWNNQDRIYVEEFEDTPCLLVCQSSVSNFELQNISPEINVTWDVDGGTIVIADNTTIQILWDDTNFGSLTIVYSIDNIVYSKVLCFEKAIKPEANFMLYNDDHINIGNMNVCVNQSIFFTNSSLINGGTDIIKYLWDFGDGNFSYIENPQHQYQVSGNYEVNLSVSNACGCVDTIVGTVTVADAKSYEISCPTLICEGAAETYSISYEALLNCTSYNWEVQGGTIINQAGGNVLVEWNDVDETGFGYVTFNPANCNTVCLTPTTIKIPIIQNNATIQGETTICEGKQSKYSLPKWPTTDVQWTVVNPNGINFQLLQTDQRNEVVFLPISGTGIITLRALYNNTLLNCGGIAEITIQVKKQLAIETTIETICKNETVNFSNTQNATVNWTITKNNILVYTQSSSNLQYIFNEAGMYLIQANNQDYCDSNILIIKVNEKPDIPASILGDNLVCPFMAYSYEVQDQNPDYFYEWSITNGTVLGSNMNSIVNVEFSNFPASLSVRSFNPVTGCYSDVVTLLIEADIPLVDINTENSTICGSTVTAFEAIVPNTSTLFTDADSFTWSLDDPRLGSVTNGQDTNNAEITWNNVTVNTAANVVLTVTKCSLPPTQILFPVIIKSIPEIQFVSGFQTSFCSTDDILITIESVDPSIILADHDVQVRWFVDGELLDGGISELFNIVNNTDEELMRSVSVQIISYDGCDGLSNYLSTAVLISPSPPAIISPTGSTRFCEASDINTVLTAFTNLIQINYQWGTVDNNLFTPIPGADLSTFVPSAFGTYACLITSFNAFSGGCSRRSNTITISRQQCNPSGSTCVIPSLTATNNSHYSGCGTITLSGSATSADAENWFVYGPGNEIVDLSTNTVTGPPGIYTIVYQASAFCPTTNSYNIIESTVEVLIPFEPALVYDFYCHGTHTTIDFILNNSIFYPFLDDPQETVQHKVNGIWETLPTSGSVNVIGTPDNMIHLRVINQGSYQGQTYECTKYYDVPTYGVLDNEIVTQNIDFICHDSALNFGFSNDIENPEIYSYKWTFEPDVTNSLFNPSRVFTIPGTYFVNVEIGNGLGCNRTIVKEVTIPEPCFSGSLQTSPSNALVCEGESVTISYVKTMQNCPPTYLWRKGNTLLPQFMDQSSIEVTEPGYYWLEVVSDQGCVYEVPNRVYPKFSIPPSLRIIKESQYCEGENIAIRAISSEAIDWYMDGTLVYQGELWNPVLTAGTYNIIVIATDSMGCATTEQFTITVVPPPTNVNITAAVFECEPFSVKLSAFADQPVQFFWNNGQIGESIVVNQGGVYQVKAIIGGCAVEASISVPKHPEVYAWAYPIGCLNYCSDYNPYILGPIAQIDSNIWQIDGITLNSSTYPSPVFQLPEPGSYSAILENGGCKFETSVLNYKIDNCDECKLTVKYNEIRPKKTDYCVFEGEFILVNETTQIMEIQFINLENQVTFVPSSFILNPGQNIIHPNILPINGYIGNSSLTMIINGTSYDNDLNPIGCEYIINQFIPACPMSPRPSAKVIEKTVANTDFVVQLSPNPITNDASIRWSRDQNIDQLRLYDLRGQLLFTQKINPENIEASISLNHLPQGTYMLTVWSNNEFVTYFKIIKK